MGNGFNKDKLKVSSKMGANRIKMQTSKLENALIKRKREIAVLIHSGKAGKARIKVESILRDEDIIKCYSLIENMCELVHQRAMFIASEKKCPEDLMECVGTLFYAAPRVDVKELTEIMELFGAKFGRDFVEKNKENKSGRVSNRVIHLLSTQPPTFDRVISKLKEIAAQNDVEFDEETVTEETAFVANPEAEEVDKFKVDELVRVLMDPSNLDLSASDKHSLCKDHGGNSAEIAAAIHIADHNISEQQAKANQMNMIPAPMQNQAQLRNEYCCTFKQRPFGMQWTETADGQNLYVSSVDIGMQANVLGVTEGSLIIAINATKVENLGAGQVFQISKATPLPMAITFRGLTNMNSSQQFAAPAAQFAPPAAQFAPAPATNYGPPPQAQFAPAAQPVPQYAQPVPVAPQSNLPYVPPPGYGSVSPQGEGSPAFNLPDVPGSASSSTKKEKPLDAFDLPSVPGTAPAPAAAPPASKKEPEFDDLEARFAALRNNMGN